jgi:hypothetical protein
MSPILRPAPAWHDTGGFNGLFGRVAGSARDAGSGYSSMGDFRAFLANL